MDHLADSTAELRQGGKDRYVGWQGLVRRRLHQHK